MSACRAPAHGDVTAGGQRRAGPGRGLDPVRQRAVGVAPQRGHAGDPDHPVSGDLDDRAHLLQDGDQVHDLRLNGRVGQFRDALGAHGRQERLLGRAHARVGQRQLGAAQPVRGGDVQPVGGLVHHGAEAAQRVQVEVDGPVADPAAAQVRDERAAQPVQQRPAQQDRDPAGAGVGVDVGDVRALDIGRVHHDLAGLLAGADRHAVQAQQAGHDAHVADVGDVPEPARRSTQQRGHHGLGNQVLRAAYRYRAVERLPAPHRHRRHGVQYGIPER